MKGLGQLLVGVWKKKDTKRHSDKKVPERWVQYFYIEGQLPINTCHIAESVVIYEFSKSVRGIFYEEATIVDYKSCVAILFHKILVLQ